jgi:hypothetical protein
MFERFKKFVEVHNGPNYFASVSEDEIVAAEEQLGFQFPDQLRQFYLEVGCGFYRLGTKDEKRDPTLVNRIVPPSDIYSILYDEDCEWRPYEGFVTGVVPFFDCGDGTYLVVKSHSANPNAVYWPSGRDSEKVTESLEAFFSQLYERAGFYAYDS